MRPKYRSSGATARPGGTRALCSAPFIGHGSSWALGTVPSTTKSTPGPGCRWAARRGHAGAGLGAEHPTCPGTAVSQRADVGFGVWPRPALSPRLLFALQTQTPTGHPLWGCVRVGRGGGGWSARPTTSGPTRDAATGREGPWRHVECGLGQLWIRWSGLPGATQPNRVPAEAGEDAEMG